uniref:Protein E18 n=2 Tax=Elephantid herpesvirus 1 TaxID=146015 RepID=A0A866VSX8_ELHV1|nr:protein E18 [Elephant endotheliotropic herpesvirus 1A]QOE75017.1 protein E18 [Elephant endotheliotropic herpesvirus 1A]
MVVFHRQGLFLPTQEMSTSAPFRSTPPAPMKNDHVLSTTRSLRSHLQTRKMDQSPILEKRFLNLETWVVSGLTFTIGLFFVLVLIYLLVTKTYRSRKYILLQQFISFLLMFTFLIFSDDIVLCKNYILQDEYQSALIYTFCIYSLMCTCVHLYGVYTTMAYNTYDTYSAGFLILVHTSMMTVLTISQTRSGALLECNIEIDVIYLVKWCIFTIVAAVVVSCQNMNRTIIINQTMHWLTSVSTITCVFMFLLMIAFRDLVSDGHEWSTLFAKLTLLSSIVSLAQMCTRNNSIDLEFLLTFLTD